MPAECRLPAFVFGYNSTACVGKAPYLDHFSSGCAICGCHFEYRALLDFRCTWLCYPCCSCSRSIPAERKRPAFVFRCRGAACARFCLGWGSVNDTEATDLLGSQETSRDFNCMIAIVVRHMQRVDGAARRWVVGRNGARGQVNVDRALSHCLVYLGYSSLYFFKFSFFWK